MQESTTEQSKSYPLSLKPSEAARILRMAEKLDRSWSAQIRNLVMPQVEAWERENGISLTDSNCQ